MKNKLIFFSIFVMVLFTMLIININETIFENEQKTVYDNLNKVLNNELQKSKKEALSLAIVLSRNSTLKESLHKEDKQLALDVLNDTTLQFHKHLQNSKIYTQILTNELRLFSRSWNPNASLENDVYLSAKGSEQFYRTPKVEVNVEHFLNIKASAPVFDGQDFMGVFEVMTSFDAIVQDMRKYKIELIPLINLQQLNYNFDDQNPLVGKNFIVANENYNELLLGKLTSLNRNKLEKLFTNEFLFEKEIFFTTYDMKNNQGKKLGKYVCIVSKKLFKSLNDTEGSILKNIITLNNTHEDLYNYAKYKGENVFLNIEDRFIGKLSAIVDEKDRLEFEEIARYKLLTLSKEQLVDFILKQSKENEIEGEIE